MLFALHTLKKQYSNKEIYIWNVNRDSMGIFVRLFLRKIDIQGFVTDCYKYVNEMCMNRTVYCLSQITSKNSVILVADDVPQDVVNMISNVKTVYWSDALEVNEELLAEKNIVYGIGQGAERLCEEFGKKGIVTELFCVTKLNYDRGFKERRVIEVSKLGNYGKYNVIISAINTRYIAEMLNELSSFSGRVFVELENLLDKAEFMMNFAQNIDLAMKYHKEIYIYGKKDRFTELMEEALNIYGVEIAGYLSDGECEENIKNIYDISYESGTENKLVIINENVEEKLVEARDNIELAGFSLEKGNYTSIQWYTYATGWMLSELKEYPDSLCGDSIIYPHGRPGWNVYGKETENKVKIMVVGGSTSSEVYHPENWVSKLYYKLKLLGFSVIVYNGAHTCNDIVSEILRVLRDAPVLKPDIIISMSGVNNTYYKKSCNQFNEERFIWKFRNQDYCSGIESKESLYSFWIRNVNLLKLISEFYGAVFLSFLQPMNFTMKDMSLREKSLFERECRIVGANDFSQNANSESDYINLMRIFEHQDEMYFDTAHYTDTANEIISDKVLDIVTPVISSLKKI